MSGFKTSQISCHTSWVGRPRAHGCLVPRTGTYASLYKQQNCGPHQSNCGNRFASRNLTAIRSEGDQEPIAPSGVCDQSCSLISCPSSPPPLSQLVSVVVLGGLELLCCSTTWRRTLIRSF